MSDPQTTDAFELSEATHNPATQTAITQQPSKTAHTKRYTYKRLTDADRVTILTLHAKNLTQAAIAERLGRSQETVNRVIHDYTPTLDLSKQFFAAKAHDMARKTYKHGRPSDYVNVLKGLGVLEEKTQSGVVINIGVSAELVQVAVSPQAAPSRSEG